MSNNIHVHSPENIDLQNMVNSPSTCMMMMTTTMTLMMIKAIIMMIKQEI